MELSRRERRSKFRHPRLRRSPPQVPIPLCDATCVNFVCTWSPNAQFASFSKVSSIVRMPEQWSRYPSARLRPVFPAAHTISQPATPVQRATHNSVTQLVILKPPCLKKRTTDTARPYSMPRWQNKIRRVPADQKRTIWNSPPAVTVSVMSYVVISHHPRSKDFYHRSLPVLHTTSTRPPCKSTFP
jgi:hypothetical protein